MVGTGVRMLVRVRGPIFVRVRMLMLRFRVTVLVRVAGPVIVRVFVFMLFHN